MISLQNAGKRAGPRVLFLEANWLIRNKEKTALVGANGTVAFPGLIGPRLFRLVGFPDSWAISSVQLDGVDISDTPVAFTPERPAALHIAVTDRTGSVTGTVLTAVGKPAVGQRVVVFLDDARRWAARSRFIKSVELGSDGRYAIRGLLPGKYLVAVSDGLDDSPLPNMSRITMNQRLGSSTPSGRISHSRSGC